MLPAQRELVKSENVFFMIHGEGGQYFQGPSHPQGAPHSVQLGPAMTSVSLIALQGEFLTSKLPSCPC